MCCEINIVGSISLQICVNVHEWFLSPMVPHNKLYVNIGIDSRRWTMLCACVISCEIVTFDTWPHPHEMCCEINIVYSISLTIGVNVQEWFLSPTVPNNKPYVHAYFRYLSKHCCVQNFFWLVLYLWDFNIDTWPGWRGYILHYGLLNHVIVSWFILVYDIKQCLLLSIKWFYSTPVVSCYYNKILSLRQESLSVKYCALAVHIVICWNRIYTFDKV